MLREFKQAIFSWRVWFTAFGGFLVVVFGLLYYAKTVYGIGGFGGMITGLTYCPVEQAYAINVGPPVGGTFVYYPSITQTYLYYQVYRPGAWVLGMSVPGSTCRGSGDDGLFTILSPSGYMMGVGTSL